MGPEKMRPRVQMKCKALLLVLILFFFSKKVGFLAEHPAEGLSAEGRILMLPSEMENARTCTGQLQG